jgi:hypothetical protein
VDVFASSLGAVVAADAPPGRSSGGPAAAPAGLCAARRAGLRSGVESTAKDQPWILIVDDPSALLHAARSASRGRENADPEVSRAAVVHIFYPLPYHDQSAHIVEDTFCLQATRAGRSWDAASYLDWLIVAPWKAEAGWKSATMEDLA